MAWSKEDRAFKIITKRRATSKDKAFYEERGAATIEVNIADLRTQTPPLNPGVEDPQERIVKKYTQFVLQPDTSVAAAQAWYAGDNGVFLTDWLDTNSGGEYGITLLDANNRVIGPTDALKWIFDYPTGVLAFNGDTSTVAKPFKITGYRYVGLKGRAGLVDVDDNATSSTKNTYSIDKLLRSLPANFMVIRPNGQRSLYDTYAACFASLQDGDRVSVHTPISNTLYLKTNTVINLNGFSSTPGAYLDGITDAGGSEGVPVLNATVLGDSLLTIGSTGSWGIGTTKASTLRYQGDITAVSSPAVMAWKGGTIRAVGTYQGGSLASGATLVPDGYASVNAYEAGKAYVTGTVIGNSVGVRVKSGGYAQVQGTIRAGLVGVLVEGTNYAPAASARIEGTVDMSGSVQADADAIVMAPGSVLTLVKATLLAKGTGKAIRGTGTVYVQGSFEYVGAIDSTITIIRQTSNYDIVPVDDTSYNYSQWAPSLRGTSKRTLALKFNQVDQLIDLLAPTKAPLMSNFVVGNLTQYSARVAAGLNSAAWYGTLITPGALVNVSYKAASSFPFVLRVNGFRAGSLNQPDSYGDLTGTITNLAGNSATASRNLRLNPTVGTSDFLTAANVQAHQNFWSKLDGFLSIGEPTEGYSRYEMEHSEAGKTPGFINFYDNSTVLPTFTSNPVYAASSPVYKYLSGLQLYGFNSTFNLSYGVANAFHNTYVASGVTQISCPGLNTVDVDFAGIPNFDSALAVANRSVQLTSANQFSDTPSLAVRVRKPYNLNLLTQSVALDKGINTYGTVSTTTDESFQDEDKRRYYPAATAFVSSTALPANEAVVYNGKLSYGSTHYPAKTGIQTYSRDFSLSTSPSGGIVFAGISYGDLSPYGTGALNVLLLLPTQGLYFDLAKPIGINNGAGTGSTPADSLGCLNTVSDKIYFTFGTNNTVNNQNIYRMIVIFRTDSGKVITKITTSKQ